MYKLRTMKVDADKSGVESTSIDDGRITKLGKLIRTSKMDEISQLWNVLMGNMSLVGPRPNTLNGVKDYTELENKLLSIKPGITDLSSIVFSDEGAILEGSRDPDDLYNKIIRPWKSKLGILYVEKHNPFLDIFILICTCLAILNKRLALIVVNKLLLFLNSEEKLIELCKRDKDLIDFI